MRKWLSSWEEGLLLAVCCECVFSINSQTLKIASLRRGRGGGGSVIFIGFQKHGFFHQNFPRLRRGFYLLKNVDFFLPKFSAPSARIFLLIFNRIVSFRLSCWAPQAIFWDFRTVWVKFASNFTWKYSQKIRITWSYLSNKPKKSSRHAWKNPCTEAQTWKNPCMIFSKTWIFLKKSMQKHGKKTAATAVLADSQLIEWFEKSNPMSKF